MVIGETTGFAHTSDLSEPRPAGGGQDGRRDRPARSSQRSSAAALGTADSHPLRARIDPSTVAKERRVALLEQADDAARSEGAAISQVQVGVRRPRAGGSLVANSEGTYADDDRRAHQRLNVICIANGGHGDADRLRADRRDRLASRCSSATTSPSPPSAAARRAIVKLDARPAPTGQLPVVLKGGSAGILFHEACGHGLEADAILKQASIYAGRVGELVASPLVTLVDDGTVDLEWGAMAIDDEVARRDATSSSRTASSPTTCGTGCSQRGGPRSSGNGRRESYRDLPLVRMTNTFLLAGTEDPDEIVAQTPYGIYVAQLSGGQVNTATGDFTFGTSEASYRGWQDHRTAP